LPQPNQQPKTTLNNFCWGGIIIGKKNHHTTTTTPCGFHYILNHFEATQEADYNIITTQLLISSNGR
jgi:hypothetical protein